ncbi:MAG: 50S ribosomal protein L2 [Candidatus Pacearchaeota archaeon]|nr:50S ribosomal protein L2 [Candidatus Pacearchaeota archaeon]
MGKTLIQQARGHGSLTYRTKKKAFRIHVSYPSVEGIGRVEKLINVACYSAPVAKIRLNNKIFYNLAHEKMYEGQEIMVGGDARIAPGNILPLGKLPIGTEVFNIEIIPGAGPKLVRNSGCVARVVKKDQKGVYVQLPSKEEKCLNPAARATIGIISASGRKEKPILKVGKKLFMKRAKGGKVYPRTSAVKMNAVDHPFGSGRGKRIKSKIAKRNAPPGQKVGLLRPRRTGRRK